MTYELEIKNKLTSPFSGKRRTSKTILVEESFIFWSIPSRLKLSIKWSFSLILFGKGSVAFKFWHDWRASLCFIGPMWVKQNSSPSIVKSIAFSSEQITDLSAGLMTTWSAWLLLLYNFPTIFLESKMYHSLLNRAVLGF